VFASTKNIVVEQFLKILADNCLVYHYLFTVCNLATLLHEVQTTHTGAKNYMHTVAGDVGSSTVKYEKQFQIS
jgi:hypothetical protein